MVPLCLMLRRLVEPCLPFPFAGLSRLLGSLTSLEQSEEPPLAPPLALFKCFPFIPGSPVELPRSFTGPKGKSQPVLAGAACSALGSSGCFFPISTIQPCAHLWVPPSNGDLMCMCSFVAHGGRSPSYDDMSPPRDFLCTYGPAILPLKMLQATS